MHVLIEPQFRDIIERELSEQGWTRSDLARAAGVRPQMVTDYLNGRRSPGPEVIERFFGALGLEPRLTAVRVGPAEKKKLAAPA